MNVVRAGWTRPTTLQMVGAVLLLVGPVVNWLASTRQGGDFAYLYLDAVAIATGGHMYNPDWELATFIDKLGGPRELGIFYPPSTGFAMLPFAPLPYRVAQFLWFATLIVIIVAGTRALVKLGKPEAARGTWMIVAGLVLLSACVRWGMTPLQGAPLVLGLLAVFVVALHEDRPKIVFLIAAFVLAFKFTMALPFLGLLLLHRRYAALAGAVGLSGALNILGFLRVGGMSALSDYRAGVATLEAFHHINTPDPWDRLSQARLDWVYLFLGVTRDLALSRILTVVLTALVVIWLLREGLRAELPASLTSTMAFLMPLVCLSVLCVYHHQYDVSPVIVPLLLLWTRFPDPRLFQHRWALWLMVPLVVMMAFLPIATTQRILVQAFGEQGPGLMNLAFPVATTLALLGSLVVVREVVGSSKTEPSLSTSGASS